MSSVRNKDGSISNYKVRRKYGKDPMFKLLDRTLPISLEGCKKKVDDPTGYLLNQLKKEGFQVTIKKKLQ